MLDKTVVFNFFSNLSIIGKTGSAVHETNKASALFNSMFDKKKSSGNNNPGGLSKFAGVFIGTETQILKV